MVTLDFITGAIVAKKNKIFQSNRVMDSVWKFMQFSVAIMLAYAIDVLFIEKIDFNAISWLINGDVITALRSLKCLSMLSFIIIIREISSIDENWEKANGWSVLKSLGKFINSKILSFFKSKSK